MTDWQPSDRVWAAAGMLLIHRDGRIFVVEPVYKDTWEIPGGVVEPGESPREACRREVGEELGLDLLEKRLGSGEVKELILATNPTVEGETTAHYLSEMAAEHHVEASRIAHGVPLGGELEYIDAGTLAHAFSGRQRVKL